MRRIVKILLSALLLAGILQLFIILTREPYRKEDCQAYEETEVPDPAIRSSASFRTVWP